MKKILTILMMAILAAGVGWAATVTGTIVFGTNNVKINAATVTGDDSQGNTWTITTTGTTSFTQNADYSQVGSSSKPATSITFTATLPNSVNVTAMSAKFGGFSGTAGNVSLKVGDTNVGTGSLNATNDVVVSSTTSATGTVLTVTVTNIAKGVKCYYISYSYEDGSALEKVATPTFSVEGGRYYSAQTVAISCETVGAAIQYSTDGTNYNNYSSPLTINTTTTLYAKATKSGMTESDGASARYVIIDNTPAQAGDEVMFDYRKGAEFAQENQTTMLQSLKNGITIDFDKGTGDNNPTWYASSYGNARVYKNNTIAVNAGDLVIENVTFTFEGTAVINDPTPSAGSYSEGVWTVGDKSAVLTMNPDASVARIATITVKLADAGVIVVAAPTISGNEAFVGSTEVTITAEDGATIYYTIDGTDPTLESTPYSAPFTINETTTVKAIAVIDGTLSVIASKTFTATPSVSTVAAFNALEDNTVIGFTGNLVAVAQKGRYLYAQDDSKGILIFGDINQTYALGSVIPAGFTGTKTTFKGAPEMENPSGFEASTTTVEVTPIELTPAQVILDNFGRYAVIRGATISDGNIVVADERVALYNRFLEENSIPTDNKTYDITGVCGYYNNAQFMPLSFTEVEAVVEPEYYLVGSFNMNGNDWVQQDPDYKFTKLASGGYALNDVELDKDVEFKIIKVDNGEITWYGGAVDQGGTYYGINGSVHTDIPLTSGANFRLQVAGTNDFVISSDMKLTVNRDAQLYMKGSYSNDNWTTKTPLTAIETGGWTLTMEMEANTQFGFIDEWENRKGGNGYWIYQNEHQYNGENVSSDMGKELTLGSDGNFVMVDAGNYTFDINSALTTLVVDLVPVAHNVIVAQDIENGTVTVDKETAIAGDVVTVTATPADGYIPDAITVMAGETAIEVVGNTFVMPDQDVTVSATFKEFVLASYFKLVTNINELDGGKQILFAGVNDDDVYVMSAPAANGNNMTAQAVVNPTSTPPSFLSYTDGYKVFSLGEFGDNYTFYDVETQKYLRATSSTSNRMGLGDLDDNATASIGLNEESTFDVVFQGEFTHNNMRFNINASNNSPLFACYQETSTMPRVYIYVETEGIPQPVVLEGVAFTADRQWATWYGDASLALPEYVTAYVVTGVQGDAVSVEALDYIPAGTGVLLYSETAAESVSAMPYTGEAGTIPTNLLMGGLETQTVSNAYLLYNNQFILAQDGTTVGAHRCYLPMSASAQGVPVLKIGTPGTVTGIETISTNGNGDNTYYNLMGQPVANPTPGIYIRGGKKVIVK